MFAVTMSPSMRCLLVALLALAISCVSGKASRAEQWTQLYFGVGVSADVVIRDLDFIRDADNFVEFSGLGGGNLSGTIFVGADFQVSPSLVVGAFAEHSWSDMETTVSLTSGDQQFSADLLSVAKSWAIGGRIGTPLTAATLAFVSAGYSRVDFNGISFQEVNEDNFHFARVSFGNFEGYFVGAGFEHRLNNNFSVRTEYRRTELNQKRTGATVFSEDLARGTYRMDPTIHSLKLSGVLRLGEARRSPADAADVVADTEPRAAGSWTQFYVGGGFGVDGVTKDAELLWSNPLGASGFSVPAETDGFGGGSLGVSITAGFDYQLSSLFVLGVFGTYDWSDVETSMRIESAQQGALSIDGSLLKFDNSWTVGVRGGILLTKSTLLYGKAGYMAAEIDDFDLAVSTNQGDLAFNVDFPSFSGLFIGAGIEQKLTNNISVRGDYRYASLNGQTARDVDNDIAIDLKPDLHIARLMLLYRFGVGP